jgi:hypothetical protein
MQWGEWTPEEQNQLTNIHSLFLPNPTPKHVQVPVWELDWGGG